MEHTQALREFWTVDTLEQAKHERVTVPPQPGMWSDERQHQLVDRIFDDVPLTAGMRVLDFGCGVGRLVRPIAARGCRVVAADVAPRMLSYCREYCEDVEGIEYVVCDGYGVAAVCDNSVDGAYSFYVFQHMPSRRMAAAVLADFYRVLKSGGWCKLQTVDIRTNDPVSHVGFRGERQTSAFVLETARNVGFRRMRVDVEVEAGHDYIALTAFK